jgi:hypothetical protein
MPSTVLAAGGHAFPASKGLSPVWLYNARACRPQGAPVKPHAEACCYHSEASAPAVDCTIYLVSLHLHGVWQTAGAVGVNVWSHSATVA